MDMKVVGKWSYIVGMVVAMLAGLLAFSASWLGLVLAVLAVLAGIFHADKSEVAYRAMRYLGLVAVAGSLYDFVFLGPYVTGLASGAAAFLGPVLLTSLGMYFWDKTFG